MGDATGHRTLVFHYPLGHAQAGYIKQVVNCVPRDVEQQAQHHPECDMLDTTDAHPGAHPDKHMVDLTINMLVARVAPPDEARAAKIADLERKCRAIISSGFMSAAKGQPNRYQSGPQHQTDFLHAVHVGGDLEIDGGAPLPHAPDEGKAVLADFVKHRDAARARLAALKAQIATAPTTKAIEAITWGEA